MCFPHIAIIGAGLSGLSLALSLHRQKIPCTLYEARSAPLNTGGGLLLTPNGLKVLRQIGVYDAIAPSSYQHADGYILDGPSGKIMESFEYGSEEKYGVLAMRAYRYTVLEGLLREVKRCGIPVHFGRRFSRVLEETEDGVSCEFEDGSTAKASMLFGADGIHSSVRNYVAPGIKPAFDGCVFLVAAIPTTQLRIPHEDWKDLNDPSNKHPMPCMIVVPQRGAFVIAPQTSTGEEVMISVMRHFSEEAESWSAVGRDKDRLRAMFRENMDQFPDIVQNALSDISDDQLRIWPSYTLPPLKSWTSLGNELGGKGRVLILGDAAHAVPPSAGQGVNQAFEDVYLLAGVLGKMKGDCGNAKLQMALAGWQSYRQQRLECVERLNQQMASKRLPTGSQEIDLAGLQSSISKDFAKLFSIDYAQAVDDLWRSRPSEC